MAVAAGVEMANFALTQEVRVVVSGAVAAVALKLVTKG
jgi:hypothetical protein